MANGGINEQLSERGLSDQFDSAVLLRDTEQMRELLGKIGVFGEGADQIIAASLSSPPPISVTSPRHGCVPWIAVAAGVLVVLLLVLIRILIPN